MFRMSKRIRSARFRLRVRRDTLATVTARDGYGSAAWRHAHQEAIEAKRALPWWLRLDIDLGR